MIHPDSIFPFGIVHRKQISAKAFSGYFEKIDNPYGIWRVFLIVYPLTKEEILYQCDWLSLIRKERNRAQSLLANVKAVLSASNKAELISHLGKAFFKNSKSLNHTIITRLQKVLACLISEGVNDSFIEFIANIASKMHSFLSKSCPKYGIQWIDELYSTEYLEQDLYLCIRTILTMLFPFTDSSNEYLVNNFVHNVKLNQNSNEILIISRINEYFSRLRVFFNNTLNEQSIVNLYSCIFSMYPSTSLIYSLFIHSESLQNPILPLLKDIGLSLGILVPSTCIQRLHYAAELSDNLVTLIKEHNHDGKNIVAEYLKYLENLLNGQVTVIEILPVSLLKSDKM